MRINSGLGMTAYLDENYCVWITVHGGKTRDEVLPSVSVILARAYREQLAAAEMVAD